MAGRASPDSSSGSSVYDEEEETNGIRLTRLVFKSGRHVLRKFLHSIHPSAKLQHVLNNNRARLQKLVKYDEQWEKLFPSSGDPPDSKSFDITLLHLLLREICHLTEPVTGWHSMPANDDDSLEANITRIKWFRNELAHSLCAPISNIKFEEEWNKIASSLEALEASIQRKKIEALKNDPIDHGTRRLLEEQAEIWRKEQEQKASDTRISSLRSCLPDKVAEERIFGRSKVIRQVKQTVESGAFPVVLITGGPGFGKTTVAKLVARKLAKPENEGTVLFCSLLSKKPSTKWPQK